MKFRGLTSFWILLKATPTVLHSTANIKAGTITSTIDTIANFRMFLCRDVLGSCGGGAAQCSQPRWHTCRWSSTVARTSPSHRSRSRHGIVQSFVFFPVCFHMFLHVFARFAILRHTFLVSAPAVCDCRLSYGFFCIYSRYKILEAFSHLGPFLKRPR